MTQPLDPSVRRVIKVLLVFVCLGLAFRLARSAWQLVGFVERDFDIELLEAVGFMGGLFLSGVLVVMLALGVWALRRGQSHRPG